MYLHNLHLAAMPRFRRFGRSKIARSLCLLLISKIPGGDCTIRATKRYQFISKPQKAAVDVAETAKEVKLELCFRSESLRMRIIFCAGRHDERKMRGWICNGARWMDC